MLSGIILMTWIGYYKELWMEKLAEGMSQYISGYVSISGNGILDFLLYNRKLTATSIISLLYLLINGLSLWFWTRSRFWVVTGISLNLFLMGLSLVIYLMGIYMDNSYHWFSTAQDIKMLLQSPLILAALAAGRIAFQYSARFKDA